MMEANSVIHAPERQRFEVKIDGALAFLSYRRAGGRVVIDHTYVPPAFRGRGVAGLLARAALEEAQRQQWSVVAQCDYVAEWIQRHPEFQSLLAEVDASARSTRDELYLLRADFCDGGKGPYFCPGCVMLRGLLETYPQLQDHVDVHEVDFARPRGELICLLGAAHQSCPVLVLADNPPVLPPLLNLQVANGRTCIEGAEAIACYLALRYGSGWPYGYAP